MERWPLNQCQPFIRQTAFLHISSSVPKLASKLPKRYAKTLQTPPTAQLALIGFQHTNFCLWHRWQCHAVKAFLQFLLGVPARNTELHRSYPGWLLGKTQVFICPSHDHMLSKLICGWFLIPKLGAYKTIPQKVSKCCKVLL